MIDRHGDGPVTRQRFLKRYERFFQRLLQDQDAETGTINEFRRIVAATLQGKGRYAPLFISLYVDDIVRTWVTPTVIQYSRR